MVGFRQILRKVTLNPLANVRKVPPISVSMEGILDALGFSLTAGANGEQTRRFDSNTVQAANYNSFPKNRAGSSG